MNQRNAFWLLMLYMSTVLVIGLRFSVPGHDLSWPGTYEAVAHIWVGILLAVIWFKWNTWDALESGIALALATAVETVMFFMRA